MVQQYFKDLDNYFKARKKYIEEGEVKKLEKLRPPYKVRRFHKVIYKKNALALKDRGDLVLKHGEKGVNSELSNYDLKKQPEYAEVIFNRYKRKYELHATYDVKIEQADYNTDKVLAIDLGVVHPIVSYDGQEVVIYNGGVVNSKLRYRNKKLSEFKCKMSRCKKNSSRYRKLKGARDRVLVQIHSQLDDLLEKYTSQVVSYCLEREISTVVLGDVEGIRENVRFHRVVSQKIYQWTFYQIKKMLKCKCEYVGLELMVIDENYTSQACPSCGKKNKTSDRNYSCSNCSFIYHRDGLGAVNIYRKYHGEDLDVPSYVVGVLASPAGVRYHPYLRCSAEWNASPWAGRSSDASVEKTAWRAVKRILVRECSERAGSMSKYVVKTGVVVFCLLPGIL